MKALRAARPLTPGWWLLTAAALVAMIVATFVLPESAGVGWAAIVLVSGVAVMMVQLDKAVQR